MTTTTTLRRTALALAAGGLTLTAVYAQTETAPGTEAPGMMGQGQMMGQGTEGMMGQGGMGQGGMMGMMGMMGQMSEMMENCNRMMQAMPPPDAAPQTETQPDNG